jgi:hypothetical protein
MAANEIHQYDIGTIFELTMMDDEAVLDISGQLLMEIHFAKPDGTVLVKIASFTNTTGTQDGVDGKMEYTTVTGDLDQTGTWKIQGIVQLPTGKWSSDISSFKVYKNLQVV